MHCGQAQESRRSLEGRALPGLAGGRMQDVRKPRETCDRLVGEHADDDLGVQASVEGLALLLCELRCNVVAQLARSPVTQTSWPCAFKRASVEQMISATSAATCSPASLMHTQAGGSGSKDRELRKCRSSIAGRVAIHSSTTLNSACWRSGKQKKRKRSVAPSQRAALASHLHQLRSAGRGVVGRIGLDPTPGR